LKEAELSFRGNKVKVEFGITADNDWPRNFCSSVVDCKDLDMYSMISSNTCVGKKEGGENCMSPY
jgi:hypothetical protein